MKCPYCGNEMEEGRLAYAGYRVLWTPKKVRLTLWKGDQDIILAGFCSPNKTPPAAVCRTCRKVIVEYEDDVQEKAWWR